MRQWGGRNDLVFVCLCFNPYESESQMSKATITFDLSIPEDAYDYKCSMKGMDACILLEQLKYSLKSYQTHATLPEIALMDIASQIEGWESP